MLKQLFLLLFSTSLLLASPQPCNLDLTPNTAELLCEDETLNLSVEYDQGANAKGKLTKISDVSGSVELAYDAKGNIASKTQTIADKTFTTVYTYNDENKLISQTYPSGKVLSYDYNTKGELTSISIDGTAFISDIQTNQNGLLSYTYSDGTTHTREYDTNGRVTKLIYPDYTEVVNYNEVSNITSITADDKTKHFDYDAIDRLVRYDLNATEYQRFTYDANGNRLSQNQEVNRSQSYIYTNNTNILEQVIHTLRVDENTTQTEKEVTYTYDKLGNIINDGSHTYTYDSRARLVGVDDNITYEYNYDNRRVSKTVNNTTTYYLYEAHKLVGEYDENGDVIKEYLYYGDTPLAVISNTGKEKIYADHLDTPRRVATQDNNIVWTWESKPFGEDKPTGSYTLNLRFPGQYFDVETGTHYNINRDYNPVTGRYIQSDPIGFDGGVNTFGYVGGSPIMLIDILGLKWSFNKLLAAYQSKADMDIPSKGGTLTQNFNIWKGNNAYSCAVRLSNAFNRAGYSSVTRDAYKNTPYKTLGDRYGYRYLFRAKEMGKHLGLFQSKYRVENLNDIYGKNGLVYFENYHVDLIYATWSGPVMYGNGDYVQQYKNDARMYFMELDL